jgi:Lipase
LAATIFDMFHNGLKLEKLHVVGHSLGCQLSSQVAQGIITKFNGRIKLKRITGLDPGNLYIINKIVKSLSHDDAEFVDIIYTDAPPNTYGTPVKTGHANFFPNGRNSRVQPGCPPRDFILFEDIELCSHQRSWRFWAESVSSAPTSTFHARKCESWLRFKTHKCDSNDIVNFGIDCPP